MRRSLVVLWPAGGRARLAGILASIVLVVFTALAPYYLGQYAADAAAAALRAPDHLPTEPVGASTLEIRRAAESYDGTFTDQRGCGIECRTLLSTGQARWVRVVEVKQFSAQTLTSSTFHRALHGKECAAQGGDLNDSAVCVVDAADPGDPANLIVDFINPIASEASVPLSLFATVVRKRTVVVRTGNTDQASEPMRQTEITVETPIRPSLFGPAIQWGHSSGVDTLRDTYKINPLTLGGVLTRLGYSLRPTGGVPSRLAEAQFRTPVDDSMTREMIAVLDLPGDAPFNDSRWRLVEQESRPLALSMDVIGGSNCAERGKGGRSVGQQVFLDIALVVVRSASPSDLPASSASASGYERLRILQGFDPATGERGREPGRATPAGRGLRLHARADA